MQGKGDNRSESYCLGRSLAIRLWVVVIALCVGIAAAAYPGVAFASGKATSGSQLYFGLTYPGAPNIPALRTYEEEIGKNTSLVLWYQAWMVYGQRQGFPTSEMDAVRMHGSIPVLAWEPDEYPVKASEPQFSLSEIANGAWDDYIHQYAAAAKAWGHPFFLRFASEMNGDWTAWSELTNGNQAGQFVMMWRHVHDIFTAEGATNVTWVWCPNVENSHTIPLEQLYPGDTYADWAGMDGYNFSGALQSTPWFSFSRVFQSTYDHILAITPKSMPIMIGETGSVETGGSKSQWITDALTTQLPSRFPRIKALIWFNIVAGNIDLRLETSSASMAAFHAAIASNTYQPNIYSALTQSPIPPPEQVVILQLAPPSTATPTKLGQQFSGAFGTLWGVVALFVALLVGFVLILMLGAMISDVSATMQRRLSPK